MNGNYFVSPRANFIILFMLRKFTTKLRLFSTLLNLCCSYTSSDIKRVDMIRFPRSLPSAFGLNFSLGEYEEPSFVPERFFRVDWRQKAEQLLNFYGKWKQFFMNIQFIDFVARMRQLLENNCRLSGTGLWTRVFSLVSFTTNTLLQLKV